MKFIGLTMLALLAGFFMVTTSLAGGYGTDSSKKSATQSDMTAGGDVAAAGSFLGMEIINMQGETIGTINELVMTDTGDEVSLVVLGKEGMENDVTIPFALLEPGIEVGTFQLTVDEGMLARAPERSSEMSDADYLKELNTFYGLAPMWEESEKAMDESGKSEGKMNY